MAGPKEHEVRLEYWEGEPVILGDRSRPGATHRVLEWHKLADPHVRSREASSKRLICAVWRGQSVYA